jgi:hypothetical protein
MIRQLVEATTDPKQVHPDLASHQAAMIERCPYLGPSVAKGLTIWSAYDAGSGDQRPLLNLLVWYAEQVRFARRIDGPLSCRNIAVFGPLDVAEAKALLDWPAWLARNLYAPVQLIVDRFWIGIGRDPKTGRSVMPPLAVSFFMIRCGIARKDRLIVSPRPTDEMAILAAGPGDDGRDVIATVLGGSVESPSDAWDDLTTAFPVSAQAT